MIATRSEDARRQRREALYSLRRILVRRLQATNRGVPRRDRIAVHRRFAEEWAERTVGGRWEDVQAVLRSPSERVGEPTNSSLLFRLAAGARPARIAEPLRKAEGVRGAVRPGADIDTSPGLKSPENPQEGRQGDLFELAGTGQLG